MADFFGKDGIHQIEGNCDLCSTACDPTADELNCLSCTYQPCGAGIYHQECLEKYLRRQGCEKYALATPRATDTAWSCCGHCHTACCRRETCHVALDVVSSSDLKHARHTHVCSARNLQQASCCVLACMASKAFSMPCAPASLRRADMWPSASVLLWKHRIVLCRNRKTGFTCPRGKGKTPGESCPGRVRAFRHSMLALALR